MIGVDNSEEMLAEAMKKQMETGQDILYLLQDMQEFELYGTVRAIISVCDSLNYITDRKELLQVFRLVNNYLDPGGIFLENGMNIYELAVFLPREDGLYEKCEELHCQKAYEQSEIEALIAEAGMELVAVYDAYTMNPASKDSERLFFVAKEKGKHTA